MTAFFSQVIAPYTTEQFFARFHEKDILHIPRNDENYYDKVLTSNEISAFLDRQDIFYPSLRIVKSGKELPAAEYTLKGVPIGHHKKDGLINTEKAFALFNNGSTFVIQAGQRYFDHLSKCCLEVSQHFNSPVQANLYITPQRSVGFNPHWDTHDVFVLQISGTKTWKLYGFEMELPTKNQKFVSKGYSKEPLQTIQLRPGDFLYVPRGYVHDAMADDGISAHITIGVLSYTWARLFAEVFPQLEENKSFREAVPFWRDDLAALVEQKAAQLAAAIRGLDFNNGLQRLNSHYQKMQPQTVNHYFQSLLDEGKLSPATQLALNEGLIYEFEESAESLTVKCLGKTIRFPLAAQPAVDFIFKNRKCAIAELPGNLSDDSKISLMRQLIREGIVYIKNV